MPDLRVFGDDTIKGNDSGGCWYLSDNAGNPIYGEITRAGDVVHYDRNDEPAAFNVLYRVADFGEVILGTLPLPPRATPYNLNLEVAKAKLERIKDRLQAWGQNGFSPSRVLKEEMAYAERLIKQAAEIEDYSPPRCADLADRVLTRAVWAGESIAVEAGRHGLNRKISDGSSRRMLLGANLFGFGRSDDYARRFENVFNYATLPFHWQSFEPEPGAERWDRIEEMLAWLQPRGIVAKGHPLVWFYEPCYPRWAYGGSFDAIRDLNVERVRRVVSRCKGRIAFWDVINEAHDADHANVFGFGRSRLTEMTGAASQTAKAADADACRIVNVSSPFGEYAAAKLGKWTPLEYLAGCLKAGVDFDAIGLQFYYGSGVGFCRDMLEISTLLDRYAALGKPIHITEIGCPSSARPDPGGQAGPAGVEQEHVGEWHGRWSESLQAEWVERFYTICCGKPYIPAVTWGDLADYDNHFHIHGGLLHEDYSPKPAYARVEELAGKMGLLKER